MIATPLIAFDRVVSVGETGIETQKFLSANELVFAGHYPHFPIYPGVFVLETILQSAERWASECGEKLVFKSVRSLRLYSPATPGDIITCAVTVRERSGGSVVLEGICTANGGKLAKGVICFAHGDNTRNGKGTS